VVVLCFSAFKIQPKLSSQVPFPCVYNTISNLAFPSCLPVLYLFVYVFIQTVKILGEGTVLFTFTIFVPSTMPGT
jgi:hypothetical protein